MQEITKTFKLPEDLSKAFEKRCKDADLNQSQVLRMLIKQFLKSKAQIELDL